MATILLDRLEAGSLVVPYGQPISVSLVGDIPSDCGTIDTPVELSLEFSSFGNVVYTHPIP